MNPLESLSNPDNWSLEAAFYKIDQEEPLLSSDYSLDDRMKRIRQREYSRSLLEHMSPVTWRLYESGTPEFQYDLTSLTHPKSYEPDPDVSISWKKSAKDAALAGRFFSATEDRDDDVLFQHNIPQKDGDKVYNYLDRLADKLPLVLLTSPVHVTFRNSEALEKYGEKLKGLYTHRKGVNFAENLETGSRILADRQDPIDMLREEDEQRRLKRKRDRDDAFKSEYAKKKKS